MLALEEREVTDHFAPLFLPVNDLSKDLLTERSTVRLVYRGP